MSPPQGVILHATNAADKLLMLTTLRLFDYDAKRAMMNDTFHHAAFAQVRWCGRAGCRRRARQCSRTAEV
jgi:hypothetical protein